ncbi:complexin-2 [Extibacter muris]|uniref:complexin-2 n=1 Tax=Extibacter muris TaxID=1796622 RepID=UPI001D06E77C|nr:complexin-2 [Extibacter muris]MCB6200823.1 complexin-2 [Extibacter muris]MCQ4662154.1 complexin-2 [Extibacter muris]MCQ4691933.1 complexin-2 [Extibacter muris]
MKNIQISEKLFIALVKYHLLDMKDVQSEIKKGLMDKMDSITMRGLYSQYKTAPTEEEKEKARKEYLDKRGVPDNFRW